MFTRLSVRRLLGVEILALTLAACAAERSEDSLDHGGQTGSLIPNCLLQEEAPYVVPEGDTALAQQVATSLASSKLTDDMGRAIPITESREGNTSILRTDVALTPGTYTLTNECEHSGGQVTREREIIVVASTPLPQDFGTLEEVTQSSLPFCSDLTYTLVSWTPSADFLPYVSLTEFTLYEGDKRLGVLPQPKPYVADTSGNVEVFIPLCPEQTTCLPGTGEYRLEARIAGEDGTWSSASVALDPQCKPDPIDDQPGPCAVAPGQTRGVKLWAAWVLPLAFWFTRRRSKQHPV